ncbi:unnamed protein product [Boreogadus saida]
MRVVNKIPKMRRVIIKEISIFKEGSISNAHRRILYSSLPTATQALLAIPPLKPQPGRGRGTVVDGVCRRHPPDGDREQPFSPPQSARLGDTWPETEEPC